MHLYINLSVVMILFLDASFAHVKKEYHPETYDQQSYGYDHSYAEDYHGYSELSKEGYQSVKSFSKDGYSSSSGLKNIAQGSAHQAGSAVAFQYAAGQQAAYQAKQSLAYKASQAAATALAALKGKEVLLQRLEQQTLEAQKQLEDELSQLLQSKRTVKTAQASSQQASQHIDVVSAALSDAKLTAGFAYKAAEEASAEYASQSTMVSQAKNRLDYLKGQLLGARSDYIATREAANKASYSAYEAQKNAQEAGKYASSGYYEKGGYKVAEGSQSSDHGYSGSYGDHHSYVVSEY